MSSKLNTVLIIAIVLIAGILGYFGFRMWRGAKLPAQTTPPIAVEPAKKFVLPVVVNKGKESEERDAILEADVRKIDVAVKEYAKDHQGAYPLSYFKNPCRGVRMCLKGIDINSKEKSYLDLIPQIPPSGTDYHYTADNTKKSYCAKTPFVLETASTTIFQCTQEGCGRAEFEKACQ